MEYSSNSEYTYTQSQAFDSLLFHRSGEINLVEPRYVVHTSSIPLPSVMDAQRVYRQHSCLDHDRYDPSSNLGYCCAKRSCMCKSRGDSLRLEYVQRNCPCKEYRKELSDGHTVGLIPLCAIGYFRAIGKTAITTEEESSKVEHRIKPEEILFCQNSIGIFDNTYPAPAVELAGVTGWNHVHDVSQLSNVLKTTYWYSRYNDEMSLDKILTLTNEGFDTIKSAVMQSIHNLNGMMVKRLLAFGSEIGTYTDIARTTAEAFSELLKEYLGLETKYGPLYMEYKEFCGFCKQNFLSPSLDHRMQIGEYVFQNKALGRFWGKELKGLNNLICFQSASHMNDYTRSFSFMDRMIIMSQTRGMGYLPEKEAEPRRKAFRDTISRPVEKVSKDEYALIYNATTEKLSDSEIPQFILDEKYIKGLRDDKLLEKHKSLYSYMEVPIKPSASNDSFVYEGGRMEDARILIDIAVKNKWKIPVRNLENGTIEDYIQMDGMTDTESVENLARILFFLSLQLTLNYWAKQEKDKKPFFKKFSFPFVNGEEEYLPDIMQARIVHISEPGKERDLTSSTSIYTWVLTPGAKLMQAALALATDHLVGLLGSSHEWNLLSRISGMSPEGQNFYEGHGSLKEGVRGFHTDWVESTNWLKKLVGMAHATSAMNYTGFPKFYGRVILKTIFEPQPVREVLQVKGVHEVGTISIQPVIWNGFIREGFMMGNPFTKPILHLVHDSARMVTEKILNQESIHIQGSNLAAIRNHPRIIQRRACMNHTAQDSG